MDLGHHVGHRELEHDQLEITLEFARAEAMAVGEPGEDMRDLRDREIAVHQIGRGEGANAAPGFQIGGERRRALLARHVAVFDPARLQRQPHEFPASGNTRPVPELVGH